MDNDGIFLIYLAGFGVWSLEFCNYICGLLATVNGVNDMNFEKWWFNNEVSLDFYNFEKEEAEKVWNAAIDSASKIVERHDISVGKINHNYLANKIKELKS